MTTVYGTFFVVEFSNKYPETDSAIQSRKIDYHDQGLDQFFTTKNVVKESSKGFSGIKVRFSKGKRLEILSKLAKRDPYKSYSQVGFGFFLPLAISVTRLKVSRKQFK